MTKNWQEEFNREFTTTGIGNEICSHQDVDDIKQFISDIRKHDEEELIKELPGYCLSDDVEVNTTEIIKKYYESK